MSYFIRIFCQSTQPIPRYNIGQFILDGAFFVQQPEFTPDLKEAKCRLVNWERFQIHCSPDQRPIVLTRNAEDGLFEAECDNLVDLIPRLVDSPIQHDLIDNLGTATQVIVIELDRENLSDEAWEMLDALEAYLAETLGGLIYAPDDGFYGSSFELLYKIG
ncbi:MAG: hypothetical protein GC179_22395 [Anaerolineaceae bacterium]|nr:hypothetical protein [Anaerolineaceae bacterium]